MLQISSIHYHIGGKLIFNDASVRIAERQRIGLVGANGSGKTTLLRLITGQAEIDGGSIHIAKHWTVGTVAQDAPSGNQTPLETVVAADTERQRLLKTVESCDDPGQLARIHERLIDIDAHSAAARAASILAGLGFADDDQSKPLSTFSGGWRMRVALASALFQRPDLLLLDEPTNHLDLESVMWLETFLRQYPGTLIIVSHDPELLNRVVNGIVLVKNGTLTCFSGNWDAFTRAQAEREALEEAMAAKQEATRKHLQQFVDRFRAKATKARQAQSRMKALERMAPVSRTVTRNPSVRFSFPEPSSRPSPLLKLDAVTAGYGEAAPVLADICGSVFNEDRIALLGANGNGKSTLARLMADRMVPRSGEIVRASKLVVGYFAQDHLEQLNAEMTALEQMSSAMDNGNAQAAREWLGRFGLGQERADVRVGSLSGGEKTRLALSLVALVRPNLMILDEPTNHLDVDSRQALMEGLNDFSGAIVLISHDRQLISTTCDQLWIVRDGTCAPWYDDLDAYRTLLLQERSVTRQSSVLPADKVSRRDSRREAAKIREALAPLRRELQFAEQALEAAETEKTELEQRMSDPAFYSGDAEEIVQATTRLQALNTQIVDMESRWLDFQERIESMEADT